MGMLPILSLMRHLFSAWTNCSINSSDWRCNGKHKTSLGTSPMDKIWLAWSVWSWMMGTSWALQRGTWKNSLWQTGNLQEKKISTYFARSCIALCGLLQVQLPWIVWTDAQSTFVDEITSIAICAWPVYCLVCLLGFWLCLHDSCRCLIISSFFKDHHDY